MRRYFLALLIGTFLFAIYSANLTELFSLTTDFGRDLYNIIKISQGNLTLIGPKMNLGGYYSGLYYYYLFAPILLISHFKVASILYFNNLLFVLAALFFFLVSSSKLTLFKSFLATLAISLSPLYIICARYPSNGYTYLPFLWILLTIVLFLKYEQKISLVILGFLCGLITNIHPTALFVLVFIIIYIFINLSRKKLIYFFIAGFISTFLPLIFFELSHNFVMTHDTFINKSYFSMLQNNSQSFPKRETLLANFNFISAKLKELLIFYPWQILIILALFINKTNAKQSLFLLISSNFSLLFLVGILRFYFEYHYIFSVAFLLLFSLIFVLVRSSFWLILGVFIIFEALFFPTSILNRPSRSYPDIDNSVRFVINHNLIKKGDSFNLIQVLDAYNLVPVGFEYRFFFRKYGFIPNSEYDYKNAKKLIIFSETPYYDIDKFKMWATEEFGRNFFTNRQIFKIGKTTIYIISK